MVSHCEGQQARPWATFQRCRMAINCGCECRRSRSCGGGDWAASKGGRLNDGHAAEHPESLILCFKFDQNLPCVCHCTTHSNAQCYQDS